MLSLLEKTPKRAFLTVEVHRARAVSVDLLNDAIQLLVGELVVQFFEDLPQHTRRYEALAWGSRGA